MHICKGENQDYHKLWEKCSNAQMASGCRRSQQCQSSELLRSSHLEPEKLLGFAANKDLEIAVLAPQEDRGRKMWGKDNFAWQTH